LNGVVIVANPRAGGGADLSLLRDRIADWPEASLCRTSARGDASALARRAADEGAEIVVAAGGDGTVHEVVAGLLEAERPAALGIIALGTGNDLVRSLEIPPDLDGALAILRRGRRRAMDLIHVEADGTTQWCVNAAAGGFAGRIHDALDSDLKRVWGPLSYLRSAVEVMGETEPWSVAIAVDGRQDRLEALNVVVANGRYAGRGIPIAPHADPFDGLLDLAVVRSAPVLHLSRLAPKLLRGEDPGDESFVSARGREVSREADRPRPFSVDGERIEIRRARFRLRPAALDVVVP
jgi:diacylglycerol kinase (ATP)